MRLFQVEKRLPRLYRLRMTAPLRLVSLPYMRATSLWPAALRLAALWRASAAHQLQQNLWHKIRLLELVSPRVQMVHHTLHVCMMSP